GDCRRGGPVIGGLVLPCEAAVTGVEGVEIVATKSTAQEHAAVDDGRRRQAMAAGDVDLPAPKAPIWAQEWGRRLDLWEMTPLVRIDLHGVFLRTVGRISPPRRLGSTSKRIGAPTYWSANRRNRRLPSRCITTR